MSKRRNPRSGGGPPRRTRPPERTGAERAYLDETVANGSPLTFHLVDGNSVRGRIEEHDERVIRVRDDDGESRLLYRRSIRMIED